MRTINRYSSPPLLYLTYLTHLYPRPPCTLFEVNPVLFVPHAGCSCCRLFYKSIAEAHFLWFSTSSSVACHSAGSRCFKGELDTVFMGWPGGRTSKEMPRSHLKKTKKRQISKRISQYLDLTPSAHRMYSIQTTVWSRGSQVNGASADVSLRHWQHAVLFFKIQSDFVKDETIKSDFHHCFFSFQDHFFAKSKLGTWIRQKEDGFVRAATISRRID